MCVCVCVSFDPHLQLEDQSTLLGINRELINPMQMPLRSQVRSLIINARPNAMWLVKKILIFRNNLIEPATNRREERLLVRNNKSRLFRMQRHTCPEWRDVAIESNCNEIRSGNHAELCSPSEPLSVPPVLQKWKKARLRQISHGLIELAPGCKRTNLGVCPFVLGQQHFAIISGSDFLEHVILFVDHHLLEQQFANLVNRCFFFPGRDRAHFRKAPFQLAQMNVYDSA